MAILTGKQLTQLRQLCAKQFAGETELIDYLKVNLNGAMQELEDWIELTATRQAISNRINTGSAPHSFNARQKEIIFVFFIFQKAKREGII